MKTQKQIEEIMFDLLDEMQHVNSMIEKVSCKSESIEFHDKRRQLKAQYNILLEVLN